MLFQITASTDAVHHGEQGIVDQRRKDAVPGVAVVVYALGGASQEGERAARNPVIVGGDDDHEWIS